MTNLGKRVQKAKAAQGFSSVLTRDKKERVKTTLIPGSKGKRYYNILRRPEEKVRLITVECRLQIGRNGYKDCLGNSNGSVCYHSLTSVILAAEAAGFVLSFCSNVEDTQKLLNLGGNLLVIESHQGNGTLYAVMRRK